MSEHTEILQKMGEVSILVVGDIMLDRFIYGAVERISPEAPVPVMRIDEKTEMMGGAGNVIANLRGLGVQAHVVGVCGNDEEAKALKALLKEQDVKSDGLVAEDGRPTSVKTRYVSGGQQLLRSDDEKVSAVKSETEKAVIKAAEKNLKKADAVILSDYNKGVLSKTVIEAVIKAARAKNIPVLVDPKGHDYSIYNGAQVVTPNKKELSLAADGASVEADEEIVKAAQSVIAQSGIKNIVATRSEAGMSVILGEGAATHIPTQALEVFDVSGAGDTVIACITAALAAGADLVTAAHIANKAGGIVVGKSGTAAITMNDLKNTSGASRFKSPLMEWSAAKAQIEAWQAQGLKVGFTNGCFDIIHHGHVSYLAEARARCDKLIMGLNHDKSVKILKGPSRPVNDEQARASVISALASIDLVVLFGAEKEGEDNTPSAAIDALRPDIIFKGGDYTVDQLPEAKVALAYGGEVQILSLFEGYSTTNIIKKSKDQAA